ncbi:MAG: phosphatase PAP2 family protein [Terrimonas sp.]|nr:phosphatase PAP2 family protein [Terrimonas sp.]
MMKFISKTSEPISLGITAGILLKGYLSKNNKIKNQGWEMAASGASAFMITQLVKTTINRDRPIVKYPFIDAYDKTILHHSFPSGHTSAAFNTATTLSLLYRKWYVVAPAFLWAAATGYSRLHLGVHYPTDVIAGAFTGAASALLTHKLYGWYIKNRRKRIS